MTQPSTEASQLPLPTPHLPSANSELSPAQDGAPGALRGQQAGAAQTQFTCTVGSQSASHLALTDQTGMFSVSYVCLDVLSVCLFQTKRDVSEMHNQATSHCLICSRKLLKRRRRVTTADKLMLEPSSIPALSINEETSHQGGFD